jgi:hypothetical protein
MPTFDTKPFYAVTCDYPGCTNRDDSGEYQWWGEQEDAIDAALDGDWKIEDTEPRENARLFCEEHSHLPYTHWLSDENPGPMSSGDEEDGLVLTLPGGERVALRVL